MIKKIKIFIVIFSLVAFYNNTSACDRPMPIHPFKINVKIKVPPPQKPNFIIKKISRGQRVRDNSSCFWLATLGTISLEEVSAPKTPQGYLIEIVKGKFEDKTIFSNQPVFLKYPYPKGSNIYNFEWSDGDSNIQEPFNITVKITGVSRSGEKSKPQYLQIKHQGVKVPWWNIWKKLPSSMTQVFEADLFSQPVVE